MERASDSMSSRPIYEKRPASVNFYLAVKRALYHVAKWIGLFALARRSTRDGLRIICYHGFSIEDESSFSPKTFMAPETFERRMSCLARLGNPVLGLGRALEMQAAGELPPNAVVITIDDGFYGTFGKALPVLKARSLPATVYVTTYYAVKESPIFRLVVQYMFWKTLETELEPGGLGLSGDRPVPIRTDIEKRDAVLRIIRHGDSSLDEEGRAGTLSLLGRRLGIDYEAIARSRILSIMNRDEITGMAAEGIDIELHSHRHDLPLDRDAALREIARNREVLEPLVGGSLVHFCFPSGFYREVQLPWLEEAGIESATTCDAGLNYADTPRLKLKRFLDGEDVSAIEFEAEISGFSEMVRGMFRALKHIVGGDRHGA
jgi:peptidoglycan/xylan/chitin deacetylase (PgdA/CDA1 family)